MPRNYLKASLLLLASEGPCHGYEFLDRTRSLGFKDAEPGNLYRALRSLENRGLVRSVWEASSTGPPRRMYELTDTGKEWLSACVGNLRETELVLDDYLRRYEQLSS